MDYISEDNFNTVGASDTQVDDSSLLTIILDLVPEGWYNIKQNISIKEVVKALIVFLNAHLSLNNANQAAFIGSSHMGSRFLYPNPSKSYDYLEVSEKQDATKGSSSGLVNLEMYRQFRLVDEAVLEEFDEELKEISDSVKFGASSKLSGAISLALTYTNRMQNLDQSISTTKASAISTTSKSVSGNISKASSSSGIGSSTTAGFSSVSSRILVVSPNQENNIDYISIMNTMFAAQKMKVPIDVVKFGPKDYSSYLQQASDATNGIYLHIENSQGLIQTLCTAFFVEPSIRPYVILPTNTNVNYRASCFITGKSIDLGYVCSVCLCIMSIIPDNGRCPTCNSEFDKKMLDRLRAGVVISFKKKRKLDTNLLLQNRSSEGT